MKNASPNDVPYIHVRKVESILNYIRKWDINRLKKNKMRRVYPLCIWKNNRVMTDSIRWNDEA